MRFDLTALFRCKTTFVVGASSTAFEDEYWGVHAIGTQRRLPAAHTRAHLQASLERYCLHSSENSASKSTAFKLLKITALASWSQHEQPL